MKEISMDTLWFWWEKNYNRPRPLLRVYAEDEVQGGLEECHTSNLEDETNLAEDAPLNTLES